MTETTRYGRLNAAVDATQTRTGLPREAVLSAFIGAMSVHVGDPTWGDCLDALGRLYAKPWDCCEHCERESGVCVDTVNGREHTAPCPECAPPPPEAGNEPVDFERMLADADQQVAVAGWLG